MKPPRQHSRKVVGALTALVLVMLTGATFAGVKLIDSYGSRVDNPLAQPSVRKSQAPIPTLPDPTVTVTVPGIPDLVRLQKNELYKVGTMASVNCKESSSKPSTRAAVLQYYRTILSCLDRAWSPIVKKAGYDFQPVSLVQQVRGSKSGCTRDLAGVFYCESELAISIDWQTDVENYRDDALGTRMWMLEAVSTIYGHHIQHLTQIMTAELSREGWAKSPSERLEWNRRRQLQAGCLGGVFVGANRKSLGLTGAKYEAWEEQVKLVGDDKGARTQGSYKNNWLWIEAGFKSANPGSCNTFSAPAAKVS
ncbi:neutral zinc metallopeptidase [Kribbella hippodromi]|uniref:neutral zinc metallopeptidase n=1 Tax=Kribbella hippodromi TaxID=434347 RepID=UPI0031D63029